MLSPQNAHRAYFAARCKIFPSERDRTPYRAITGAVKSSSLFALKVETGHDYARVAMYENYNLQSSFNRFISFIASAVSLSGLRSG